jgi:hypothetical protein
MIVIAIAKSIDLLLVVAQTHQNQQFLEIHCCQSTGLMVSDPNAPARDHEYPLHPIASRTSYPR